MKRARMKTTTESRASAISDWTNLVATKRISRRRRASRAYFEEASASTKRSYMTVPGFHLPSVLEVAYAECR